MCSAELNGIYIHTQPQHQVGSFKDGSPDTKDKNSSASSGIVSNSSSITSNNNFATMARKRNLSPDGRDIPFETQLDDYEMEKIRRIMVNVDGDRRGSGGSIASSHRGSIEPSLMSTVFAVVLVIIISITVYAFTSLYKAVMKRLNDA